MLWLLLGMLLFGGKLGDMTMPAARAAMHRESLPDVVTDPAALATAQAIADRMVAEATTVEQAMTTFTGTLGRLDAAATPDSAAYRAALATALDQIDAAEARLVAERHKLRAAMTPEQWRQLMQNVLDGM